jgi:molecular chaperone GrpE
LFAISKFAKDLLEVRDNLSMALEHINMDEIKELEDVEQLRAKIEQVVKGQEITSKIMDKVLLKFDVSQFDPAGEKFDPNVHDAIYVIPKSD